MTQNSFLVAAFELTFFIKKYNYEPKKKEIGVKDFSVSNC